MNESEELYAVFRQDFLAFAEKCISELNPERQVQSNWHLGAIAYKLMQVERGEIKRLVICLPPRHGKSHLVSVAFVGWMLGHHPQQRFMCASYNKSLANELSRETRIIMTSDWYKSTFDTRIGNEKNSEEEFLTTRLGGRRAVSIEAGILGKGGDIIIGDDLMLPDDCRSPEALDAALDKIRNSLMTRLNNPNTGAIILVMQRLHENDFAGYAEERGWETLKIPAIATEACDYQTPHGTYHRKAGAVLHEERMDQKTLEAKRLEIGNRAFEAQYQQNPVAQLGNIFKLKYFRRFSFDELDESKFAFVFQSWDVASSVSDKADYSVCTTWGVMNAADFYLLDVVRVRKDLPELYDLASKLIAVERPDIVVVEKAGVGAGLKSLLAKRFGKLIVGAIPQCDKVTRAEKLTAFLAEGHVYLPEKASWFDVFWNELRSFPQGKYDDQVDSFTQFVGERCELLYRASRNPQRPLAATLKIPNPGPAIAFYAF